MRAPAENKIRWLYLMISTLILLFGGLIYGWSFFVRYFSAEYPTWKPSQLSMTFTISMTCFCIGGLISGKLVQRVSQRILLWVSAILILTGFIGVSGMDPTDTSGSLIRLYVCYGVLAGLGVGACYNVVISVTGKWFPDKSGVAIGTMMMGFGSGALILSGIAEAIIGASDVFHAFLIIGIGCLIVLMSGSFILRNPEVDVRTDPEKISGPDKNANEVLHSPSFWLFFLWAVIVNIAGFAIIGNAATIAVTAGAPALMGLIVSVCNGIGRIVIGSFYDRFERIRTMMLNMCLLLTSSILLIAGTITGSAGLVIIGLMVIGIEFGGCPIICSSFVRGQFGQKYYSTNFGLVNFSVIPAALIGPGAASLLYESSGGSYLGTYVIMVCCAVLGGAVFLLLNKVCSHDKANL